MKAIVCTKYGTPDVLELQEVEKSTFKSNEVLVRVYASSVTAADCMMRKRTPLYGRLFLGLTKPNKPITGTGFAGVIEAVGEEVKLFKEGDSTKEYCNLWSVRVNYNYTFDLVGMLQLAACDRFEYYT